MEDVTEVLSLNAWQDGDALNNNNKAGKSTSFWRGTDNDFCFGHIEFMLSTGFWFEIFSR